MAQHRLPTPGSDDGDWGDILNDFLQVSHNSDGTIANATVGTNQIQNSAVTTAKLDSSTQANLTAASTAVQSVNSKTGTAVTLTAGDVSAVATVQLGAASGVATLDGGSKLTASQVPSSVVSATGAPGGDVPVADGSGGYAWSAPAAGGINIVKYAFDFSTPGLTGAGAVIATLQVGDMLSFEQVSNPAAWNGNAPTLALGTSADPAVFANIPLGSGVDQINNGLVNCVLSDQDIGTHASVATGAVDILLSWAGTMESLLVADAPPPLPLTVITGVNDTFNFVYPNAFVEAETVAAGTYTTAQDLGNAIVNAIPVGGLVASESSGAIVLTLSNQNLVGASMTTGDSNDILASTGITPGQTFNSFSAPIDSTTGSCQVVLGIYRGLLS